MIQSPPGATFTVRGRLTSLALTASILASLMTFAIAASALAHHLNASDLFIHVTSGTTAISCETYDNTAVADAVNDGQDTSLEATVTVECPGLNVLKEGHLRADAHRRRRDRARHRQRGLGRGGGRRDG